MSQTTTTSELNADTVAKRIADNLRAPSLGVHAQATGNTVRIVRNAGDEAPRLDEYLTVERDPFGVWIAKSSYGREYLIAVASDHLVLTSVPVKDRAPAPVKVGDAATIACGTDLFPATVVGIDLFKSGPSAGLPRRVIVQMDSWDRRDRNGMSDDQHYSYDRDPNGRTYIATYRKTAKCWMSDGQVVTFGSRRKWIDYSI